MSVARTRRPVPSHPVPRTGPVPVRLDPMRGGEAQISSVAEVFPAMEVPPMTEVSPVTDGPLTPAAGRPGPAVDSGLLKQAMRRLPGGVVVVTAGEGEERAGFTATSAVSLSVDPPTMLVCVSRASSTWPVIARRRHFCVSVLGAEHQAVAERFAGIGALRGAARYAGAEWVVMHSGASGLAQAQAIVDCEVDEVIERHSHAILLGAVREVRVAHREGGSLVYRLGRFGALP